MKSWVASRLSVSDSRTNGPSLCAVFQTVIEQTTRIAVAVKPGERAECHRHTAAALRFVVEGDGTGFTNVEGEEMLMEPGDLVLTPNWTWHDHFNPGKNNIVWLDVLDSHLSNYLDASFHENYGEGPAQPIMKPDGYCKQQYGAIRPRMASVSNAALPYTYKWRDTLRALNEVAAAGDRGVESADALEASEIITDSARFGRSAGGVGAGIEVDDDLASAVGRQGHRVAVLIRELEVGGEVAFVHARYLSSFDSRRSLSTRPPVCSSGQ